MHVAGNSIGGPSTQNMAAHTHTTAAAANNNNNNNNIINNNNNNNKTNKNTINLELVVLLHEHWC